MIKEKYQAYPSPKQILGSGEDYHEIPAQSGLTKLEYAAISAMQGILSGASIENKNGIYVNDGYIHPESVAKNAVAIARALFAELEKEENK